MKKQIEFFGSLQSPYCYFALDRLEELVQRYELEIVMRPVLPGVIRIPDAYADRGLMEQNYFALDVARTAAFLGVPFADAKPSPVNWQPGSLWIASPDQARVKRLYNMMWQCRDSGLLTLYCALMRHIWSGRYEDWDHLSKLEKMLKESGLPVALADQPDSLIPEAETFFANNQQSMFDAGHWGVPMFVFEDVPFYGQDRLDHLYWAISKTLRGTEHNE